MNEYIRTNGSGTTVYYKDKEMTILHRIDGPAIESANGDRAWYLNGKRHRMDGPAIEWYDGGEVWLINGVHIFDINRNGKLVDRMR